MSAVELSVHQRYALYKQYHRLRQATEPFMDLKSEQGILTAHAFMDQKNIPRFLSEQPFPMKGGAV